MLIQGKNSKKWVDYEYDILKNTVTKIVCAKGNNSGAEIDKIIHSLKIPSEICDKLTESCDESLSDTY